MGILNQVNCKLAVSKEEYKEKGTILGYHLNELQRLCRHALIPTILVFEGWDAADKGASINRLLQKLDPRGFRVFSLEAMSKEERSRPWLWRTWIKLPAKGMTAVFNPSWYRRLLVERIDGYLPESEYHETCKDIRTFERWLIDDGTVLIKFWLHISRKEQIQRLKKLEADPIEAWRVTPDSWKHQHQYAEYYKTADEMIKNTSTSCAPWRIIEAENKYYGTVRIFETIVSEWEKALSEEMTVKQSEIPKKTLSIQSRADPLDHLDLHQKMDPVEYKTHLDNYQKEIQRLHIRMFREKMPAVVVFEGWDAAGKGGAIRRLLQTLDPRGYTVVTTAAPEPHEKRQHYLWRFFREIPPKGHLTVFDRSWYGRVLVERIERLCSNREWSIAYQEINEFEDMLIRSGIPVIKFWLQIDKEEQLSRFKARELSPQKFWKMSPEDYRNRQKWAEYEEAVKQMVLLTSPRTAPWTIVESNNKYFSRIKVIREVCRRLSEALSDTRLTPPA